MSSDKIWNSNFLAIFGRPNFHKSPARERTKFQTDPSLFAGRPFWPGRPFSVVHILHNHILAFFTPAPLRNKDSTPPVTAIISRNKGLTPPPRFLKLIVDVDTRNTHH